MKQSEYDIVVIGAGSAGIGTALALKEHDLRILYLERNDIVGGRATASAVGTICGLYTNGSQIDAIPVFKGAIRSFTDSIAVHSERKVIKNAKGLNYLPYEIQAFKDLGLKAIRESGADLILNAEITNVRTSGDKIESLDIKQEKEQLTIKGKAFVDCSGNGIISLLAGLEMIVDEKDQSPAIAFGLKGISTSDETAINLSIARHALKSNSDINVYIRSTTVVPGSLHKGKAIFKMGIPSKNNGSIPSYEIIREKILEVFKNLKGNIAFLESTDMDFIADEIGMRTNQRCLGEDILSKRDVLNCSKPKDSVALGTWPMEEWSEGYKVEMKHLKEGDYYGIPFGALHSKFKDNLFFAGKCISSDFHSIASARVIGTCLSTGYAAGEMAAGYVNGSSRSAVIERIADQAFSRSPSVL